MQYPLNSSWRVKCKMPFCEGHLIPDSVETKGQGGAAIITFCCSKCGEGELMFKTASTLDNSKRNIITQASYLAFLISRTGYAGMRNTLGLGLDHISLTVFFSVLKDIHPVVKEMLDNIVEETKRVIKAKPDDELNVLRCKTSEQLDNFSSALATTLKCHFGISEFH